MSTISTVSVDFVAHTVEFTEGLEQVRNSSIKFSDGFHKDMEAVQEDLTSLSKLAVGAFLGLGAAIAAGVGEAVESIAKMSDASAKLGISVESYQALAKAAAAVGTDMGALTGAINHVQAAMDAAVAGGTKQIDAFNKLGLSVTKLEQLSPDQRFAAIADALNGMTNENDKASAAMDIFGKSVSEIRPLLDQGSEGIAKAAEEAANMGVLLSSQAVKGVKDFQVSINELKETAEGQFKILAAAVAPVAKSLVEGLTPSAKEAGAAFDNLNKILDVLETPLYMIALGVDTLITAFFAFRAAVYGLASVWLSQWASMIDGFNVAVNVVQQGVNFLIAAWNKLPFVKNKIAPVDFGQVFQGAKATLKDFSDFAAQQMAKDSATASDAWNNGFSQKFENGIATVRNNINKLKTDAIAAGNAVGKSITTPAPTGNNIDLKPEAGTDYLDDLKKNIKDFYDWVNAYYAKLGQVANKYRDTELKAGAEIIDIHNAEAAGMLNHAEAIKAIDKVQTEAFEKTNTWVKPLAQAFTSMADGMASAIQQGKGLGDVFKNMIATVEQMILKYLILEVLMAMLGLVDLAAGTKFASAFGSISGLTPKATGGSVAGSTPYMVGEKGPELFVPNNSGYIVPNDKLGSVGGGSTMVNQTINVTAGVAQTVRAEMMRMMPALQAQTLSAVAQNSRRGGSFAKALKGTT